MAGNSGPCSFEGDMKRLLIVALLFASFGYAQQRPKPTAGSSKFGFHGISLGQLISTLPFRCSKLPAAYHYCEGIVDNNLVTIDGVEKSRVTYFSVLYPGPLFRDYLEQNEPYGYYDKTSVTPINLAQAIRLHSLQKGARTPQLCSAGKAEVKDLANNIVYVPDSDSKLTPEGIGKIPVNMVIYTAASVMDPAHCNPLGSTEASLLTEARSATSYVPTLKLRAPTGPITLSSWIRHVALHYLDLVEKCAAANDSEKHDLYGKFLDDQEKSLNIDTQGPDRVFVEEVLKQVRRLGEARYIDDNCVYLRRTHDGRIACAGYSASARYYASCKAVTEEMINTGKVGYFGECTFKHINGEVEKAKRAQEEKEP